MSDELLLRVHDLTIQLDEARETLDAIRRGEVDALLVKSGDVESVYTLRGADHVHRMLFETLNEGVFTLSRDGIVLYANSRLATLLGLPIEQILGAPFAPYAVGCASDLEVLLERGRRGRAKRELLLRRRDGVAFPAMVSVSELGLADAPGTVAVVVSDLSELDRLRDADRRKDEFIAMLSHELRNPLATMSTAAALIRLRLVRGGDTLHPLEVLDRQVANTARLLDDLLDVSRITRGKVRLVREQLELQGVVAAAVEAVRPLVDKHRHTIRVRLPPEPVWLSADRTRLEQVLVNLLTNAAKYMDEGGTVDLTVERTDVSVVIRVKDTGIGIDRELLPRVFDSFTQAEASLDRSQGGLGLGLALVRGLVELHGGAVEARSEGLGKGSEFVARFPVVPAGVGEEGRVAPAAVERTGGSRVLLVDDNVDLAAMLAEAIGLMGHEVRTAHDGAEGLAVAERFHPDFVVLDIGLPDRDGYAIARELRARHGPNGPVLIALTGYGQESDRAASRNAGFSHHLVKPPDMAEVRRLLSARRPPR